MELMLAMEESDGSKSKSCTVHTQTDFGPYSAFPPPGPYSTSNKETSPAKNTQDTTDNIRKEEGRNVNT